jgi:hypothetical protein
LLAGVALFILAPQYVSGWAFNIPGTTDVALAPAFFPRLASAILIFCSLLVLATIPFRSEALPIATTTWVELSRVALGLCAILIYIISIGLLGFVTSSIIFVSVASWVGGYRRPVVVILTAIIASIVIRVVFRFGLNVNLPTGMFI